MYFRIYKLVSSIHFAHCGSHRSCPTRHSTASACIYMSPRDTVYEYRYSIHMGVLYPGRGVPVYCTLLDNALEKVPSHRTVLYPYTPVSIATVELYPVLYATRRAIASAEQQVNNRASHNRPFPWTAINTPIEGHRIIPFSA